MGSALLSRPIPSSSWSHMPCTPWDRLREHSSCEMPSHDYRLFPTVSSSGHPFLSMVQIHCTSLRSLASWMARNRNSRTKKGGMPCICIPPQAAGGETRIFHVTLNHLTPVRKDASSQMDESRRVHLEPNFSPRSSSGDDSGTGVRSVSGTDADSRKRFKIHTCSENTTLAYKYFGKKRRMS